MYVCVYIYIYTHIYTPKNVTYTSIRPVVGIYVTLNSFSRVIFSNVGCSIFRLEKRCPYLDPIYLATPFVVPVILKLRFRKLISLSFLPFEQIPPDEFGPIDRTTPTVRERFEVETSRAMTEAIGLDPCHRGKCNDLLEL